MWYLFTFYKSVIKPSNPVKCDEIMMKVHIKADNRISEAWRFRCMMHYGISSQDRCETIPQFGNFPSHLPWLYSCSHFKKYSNPFQILTRCTSQRTLSSFETAFFDRPVKGLEAVSFLRAHYTHTVNRSNHIQAVEQLSTSETRKISQKEQKRMLSELFS